MYEIKDKELENFIKLAEEESCYFITVTRIKPEGKLTHFCITKKFPKFAMIPTVKHFENHIQDEFL